jgi:hypothetical protein
MSIWLNNRSTGQGKKEDFTTICLIIFKQDYFFPIKVQQTRKVLQHTRKYDFRRSSSFVNDLRRYFSSLKR